MFRAGRAGTFKPEVRHVGLIPAMFMHLFMHRWKVFVPEVIFKSWRNFVLLSTATSMTEFLDFNSIAFPCLKASKHVGSWQAVVNRRGTTYGRCRHSSLRYAQQAAFTLFRIRKLIRRTIVHSIVQASRLTHALVEQNCCLMLTLYGPLRIA